MKSGAPNLRCRHPETSQPRPRSSRPRSSSRPWKKRRWMLKLSASCSEWRSWKNRRRHWWRRPNRGRW